MTLIDKVQTESASVQFPPNFIWGAATASYQIEGATHEDGRSECIWDRYAATPGMVVNGESGAVACDHYHRWREDIQLMKNIGLQAYRFSVAWPRVIPTGRGAVNEKGLDFYDRLVDGLLEAGIQPYATLYHWDLPQILQDQGGWPNRDTAYAFAEYTEAVVKRLGDRVKGWITHNEPWCVAFLGYNIGRHAPGLHDYQKALETVHHLLLGHGLAIPIIRQYAPQAEVGITLNLGVFQPETPGNEADEEVVQAADAEQNRIFLDPIFRKSYPADHQKMQELSAQLIKPGDLDIIAAPIDFVGINYYTRGLLRGNPDGTVTHVHPEGTYTTMGWEVYPEGIYELLTRMKREYPSRLYITENGASSDDKPYAEGKVVDELRLNYLDAHFRQSHRAIQEGVELDGYFVWSLMDNFEWAFGYSKRFGITYVNYDTQERILKKSGHWYSGVIKANGLQ